MRILYTPVAALLVGGLFATGCASKKFVRNKVAPVEERVGQVETETAGNAERIQGLEGRVDKDVSRLDERTDAAAKEAAEAREAALRAQESADEAGVEAGEARSFAGAGLERLERTMIDMTQYRQTAQESILFGFDRSDLTQEAIGQLDGLVASIGDRSRYVVEVRGFTDSTGSAEYNLRLSQRRAEGVVRQLNAKGVPLRYIHRIGLGAVQPAAENDSREGRERNRRVEVTVYVPIQDAGVEVTSQ